MEFLSFELAKKLKEKGFREKVNAYYGKHENIFEVHPSSDMNDCYYSCSAPTTSQVLKWLREEKNIHISPVLWGLGWYVDIQSFTKETDEDYVSYDVDNKFQSIDYETYEEAVIAGVNYCLENLI